MPHAGRDDKPYLANVDNRSGGYGFGQNLDAVKGNNNSGVMDLHFLNSKGHASNAPSASHQKSVKEAANVQ